MKYNTNNKRLNIEDFQHPFDKRSVVAIKKLPVFDKLIEFISKNSVEKVYGFMNHSSMMKISKEMSPKIFEMLSEAAQMYNSDCIPEIFVDRSYDMRISLYGINKPFIIFSTSLLEQSDDEMLWNLIASEYAGIPAKHSTIKFVDVMSDYLNGFLPFGVDYALDVAINDWYRNMAYTYDRAFLLTSESFKLAAKHILFGEVPEEILDKMELDKPENSFMEQSVEFFNRKGSEGVYQKINTVFTRNQWLASRYFELYNWYSSGEYLDVLEGSVE